jgi:PST family polysaccharide transporter
VIFTIFYLGDYIILEIFGNKFFESIYILKILILSTLPIFIGSIISIILLTHNIRIELFYAAIFGLIINIIMNLILIPKYGAVGSAYSTVVSYSFSSFIYFLFHKSSRNIIFNIFKNSQYK